VYRMFVIDKKRRITTDGFHVSDCRIPLPPDWPICLDLRSAWPATTSDRRVEYYNILLTSSKNASLGKCFVPGILYK
jgi:hypothetical protein